MSKSENSEIEEQVDEHNTQGLRQAESSSSTTGEHKINIKANTNQKKNDDNAINNASATRASEISTSIGSDQNISSSVIAVSAAKPPTVFCNLARKFLISEEFVHLSALEGAILYAIDASHLLERSQLATIVRIETSYVSVEPRKRGQKAKGVSEDQPEVSGNFAPRTAHVSLKKSSASLKDDGENLGKVSSSDTKKENVSRLKLKSSPKVKTGKDSKDKQEQRRARIMITLRRTSMYSKWLVENPQQFNVGDDEE